MNQIISKCNKYLCENYKRFPVVIKKGKGSFLWDIDGKKYIDLFPGWGAGILGHCPSKVVEAVNRQAKTLIHMPNNFYTLPQVKLGELLSKYGFRGRSFFCNSGAEANEAAIKLARLYGNKKKKYKIISFKNSFHGRTYGALSATGQKKYQKDMTPMLPGFKYANYNDMSSVRKLYTKDTCAVILELIQGEGGIVVGDKEFIKDLYKFCKENDVLFIVDEVQTGGGRCGTMFLYQQYGIVPDIMTLAKGIGSGFPIGIMHAREEIAKYLIPGTHASTFGGNPIATTAGIATIETIIEEKLLDKVKKESREIYKYLEEWKNKYKIIKEVRGIGFMIGVELTICGNGIVEKALEKGVIINCTHERIIRFLPAINIPVHILFKGLKIIEKIIEEFS